MLDHKISNRTKSGAKWDTFTSIKYGIYSILIGKFLGIIIGQTGFFSIIRWKLRQIKLLPPKEYWISLLPVIAASLFSLIYHHSSIILIISVFFFLVESHASCFRRRFLFNQIKACKLLIK